MKWPAIALFASSTTVLASFDEMPKIRQEHCKFKLQSLESPPFPDLDGKYLILGRTTDDPGSRKHNEVGVCVNGITDENAAIFSKSAVAVHPLQWIFGLDEKETQSGKGKKKGYHLDGPKSNDRGVPNPGLHFPGQSPQNLYRGLVVTRCGPNKMFKLLLETSKLGSLSKRESNEEKNQEEEDKKKGGKDAEEPAEDPDATMTFEESSTDDKKKEEDGPNPTKPLVPSWAVPQWGIGDDKSKLKNEPSKFPGKWVAYQEGDGDNKLWALYWKVDGTSSIATDRPVNILCEAVRETSKDDWRIDLHGGAT